MTTAMQIGRVGLDIDLSAPLSWQEAGDQVTIEAQIKAPHTAATKRWLAEQIVNLAGPYRSEVAVPFTTTAWADRDCWVEVLETSVSPEARGSQPGTGPFRFSASMRRLKGRKQPRYELGRGPGGVIANDHSITKGSYAGWVSFPGSADAVDLGDDVTWTRGNRTTEDGFMAFVTGGSTTLYNTVVSMYCPLVDAYRGAATIEVDIDGNDTWRAITGKEIRLVGANRVRLTNGLVRWTWDTTYNTLQGEVYVVNTWEPLDEDFAFTTGGASLTPLGVNPSSVWVVRNDPLRVTLQFTLDYQSGTHRIVLFLSLRRGDLNLLGSIKSSSSRQFGIDPGNTLATSLTSGIRRNGDDTNGNRWILASPRTFTTDLSDGWIHLTTGSKSFPFGIGIELGGSASTGQLTAANVLSQYYAQPPEQLYISIP